MKKLLKKILPAPMISMLSGLNAKRKTESLKRQYGIKLKKLPSIEFWGSDYSGFAVPANLINKNSLCYCIGVGEEITFEQQVLKKVGCETFLFDPTPRSKAFIEKLLNHDRYQTLKIQDSDKEIKELSKESIHFYPYAVWNEETVIRMWAPKDPSHVSHSILNLQHTDTYFEAQSYTLSTFVKTLNHKRIDLLKLNVEGAEYGILESMLNLSSLPKVLCVTFDEFHTSLDGKESERISSMLGRLNTAGYSPVYMDSSRITFVNEFQA